MPSTKTLNQSPTISAVENTDLLWIWDSSASELNKISRTNLLTTTDDFNTSYARLAGRSGGQTLIGGTAANDDLTLEGTSSATRTTSYVILQPNGGNVGIGVIAPLDKVSIAPGQLTVGFGDSSRATLEGGNTIGGALRLYDSGTETVRLNANGASWISNGNVGIGVTNPSTRLDIDAGAIEFAEMTSPAAGAVNTGRLFCQDNGFGKTQLCIVFSSGAVQVIATQP